MAAGHPAGEERTGVRFALAAAGASRLRTRSCAAGCDAGTPPASRQNRRLVPAARTPVVPLPGGVMSAFMESSYRPCSFTPRTLTVTSSFSRT